ncbi:HAD family hydrolase [Halospeciosus flavus]|uniref:HAD family hydrolase n=1 Tax=Halospeciosus flavus TaxID=3032283 RepID=A0ABD5Z0N7_9EURY|nr:HAD family hydrolase [Halospeciosus flavus]
MSEETDREEHDEHDRAYDAVFWDIGGVLLDLASVREAHAAFVARLVEEFDVDADPDDALERWREVVGEHFRTREGTEFRSAVDGYGEAVDVVVGREVPRDEWFPLFRESTREHVQSVPHAREVVRRLHEAGVYQGVVSDVDTEEGLFLLEQFGVREFLDDVTTSEEVGKTKPNPAMFETALAKSPHPPERTVMVGDRYEHDVAGAAEHGIDGVSHGADDGPAVAHEITDLRELLAVVGVDTAAGEVSR